MLSFVLKVKYISLTYTIEIINIWTVILHSMVFSFVCMGFFVQIDNYSLIWRRHHYRWRAVKFDLCLARMAIEQRGFLSVPHLLWHGARGIRLSWSFPRTRVTNTYCPAFCSGAVSTCFRRGWDSNTQPSAGWTL